MTQSLSPNEEFELRIASLEQWRDQTEADIKAELAAGRDLAYAIFHSPASSVAVMPDAVLRAYGRAAEVMRIGMRHGRRRPAPDTSWVEVGPTVEVRPT
jgi:hypothetical protein